MQRFPSSSLAPRLLICAALILGACRARPAAEGPAPGRGAAAPAIEQGAEAEPDAPAGPGVCTLGGRPTPRDAERELQRPKVGRPVVELFEQPMQTQGSPAPSRPLERFTPQALQSWRRPDRTTQAGKTELVYRSPRLQARLANAPEMRLTVRPGGATAVRVLPVSAGGGLGRDRAFRTQRFSLAGSDAEAVQVSIDLQALIQHSWDSVMTQGALLFVEVVFEDPNPEHTRLLEVSFPDRMALYPEAAGTLYADVAGVIRPAIYVHHDAVARYELQLPPDAHSLRMHLAGTTSRPLARVRLSHGGESHILFERATTTAWAPARADVSKWAGKQVTLELMGATRGVALFGAPRIVGTPSAQRGPDLLIYMVDTLVATRLGAWGSPLGRQGVSPTIDRIAAHGLTFGHAVSPAPWTKPTIASLLTGIDPTVHRVGAETFTDQLPDTVPTLQDRFREAGYRTGAFVSNLLGSTLSGLQRGFHVTPLPAHWQGKLGPLRHPSSAQLQNAMLAWVDLEPEQPFAAYLHTLEVHEYGNPLFDWPRPGWTNYDHAIRAQDGALATLMQELRRRKRDVILVFLSDHGESFGDHGIRSHGYSLYHPQLHVPLIFYSPRHIPRATYNEAVTTLDLAPTLLDLFGLPALPMADGRSLLPRLRGEQPARNLFASRQWYVWDQGTPPIYASLLPDGDKALLGGGRDSAVYDLQADPCERRPEPYAGSDAAEVLQQWLDERDARAADFEEKYGKVDKGSIQAQDLEQLRSLGYVQ